MTQDGPGNGEMGAPVPSAATEGLPEGFLAPGQVLGDRYQIKSQLGRGGMGEVWRAFDLKLRVEVALKAMLPDLFKDDRRRDMLRREVRAAREVVSPNVCRIFDLIEVDGTELVSMEYVDGGTLLELLAEGGPLDLKEAQDIASQFLAGLEAIHQAGLVHRDVKPENIMITRAGRVVLMDFGLARQEDSGAGTVAGTPAYMAPEQAAGLQVDARADVYSAGVVLAEMVSPDGVKDFESRQSVWEGIRQEPARVPDSPWAPVLKKAVAKERDQRHNSAHTLIRELEDVTLRVEGAEDLTPYPGLASFTEEDAEYFFGREAEVEAMWAKLDGPARLLGLVGASGAGKTSFLRAGVIPKASPEWAVVRCTPGSTAIASLRRALVPALRGDTEALSALAAGDDEATVSACSVWRAAHGRALLIVDQFEELFTLNSPETQAGFAGVLQRLPLEADVHVVLAMRDDFLMECNRFESLRAIVPDLTLLDPPTGANLRRALVNPATKCGYRFEDDDLVDEMLGEVEGERGALPLLAFAVARLWEKRDRENGLVTRQASQEIGGVGGALALHAETTLDRLGSDRISIVRELFRNLVTAESTRAVSDMDELLSVFDPSQRNAAEEVLRGLIDARLLTSYEVHGENDAVTRSVEIIHESLLANWPRLVRWQTQDADAAQLRDQLRQAVRTWDEHDRSEDLLWTGSAYREYAVWRERYPGGLTDTEEAFGSAMKSLATRRRRRRRLAVAAGFAILLAGFTIVASFWQRSVRETRRAEAAELVALGQLELEGYPTASVAYAMTSLELADSRGARMLAIEALWRGPTAFIANETPTVTIAFTPDGRWLTQSYAVAGDGPVGLIGADGTTAFLEGTEGHEYIYPPPHGEESDLFAMQDWGKNQSGENVTKRIVLFSASEGRIIAEAPYDQRVFDVAMIPEDRRLLMMIPAGKGRLSIDSLGFDGQHTRLGTREFDLETDRSYWHKLDTHNGRIVATKTGHDIFVTDIGQSGLSQPRLLGREKEAIGRLAVDPKGRFVASATVGGDIRLWPLKERLPTDSVPGPPNGALQFTADGNFLCSKWWGSVDGIQTGDDCQFWIWAVDSDGLTFLRRTDVGRPAPLSNLVPDNDGGRFVRTGAGLAIRLWRRSAPADAEPLELLRGQVGQVFMPAFHPEGRWLAVADNSGLGLWPLARPYPIVIRRHTDTLLDILFAPDGSWLASAPGAGDGMVMLWPLGGIAPSSGRAVFDPSEFAYITALATNSDGSKILVTGGPRLGVHFVSLDDESTDILPLSESCSQYFDVAISHDGRMAAATCGVWDHESRKIDIWDLTRREHVAELAKGESVYSAGPVFVGIGQLLALDVSGLRRWDLDTGSSSLIHEGTFQKFVASKSARRVLLLDAPSENDPGRAVFVDLDTGVSTVLETHGGQIRSLALDAEGTVAVTGDLDGTVRIGYVTGEEPRVLLGQKQAVEALDIDPLGRWVASGGKDTTIRLWPMPDLSKPPLHTLPREELIAKLKTLTNLRVVRDEDSATGWKLTHDPFPGWETVPTW